MEYTWDMDRLCKYETQIKRFMASNKHLKKEIKIELQMSLQNIRYMNSLFYNSPRTMSIFKQWKMNSIQKLVKVAFQNNEKIPTYLIDMAMKSASSFMEYDACDFNQSLPRCNFSNQELVDMSEDFFRWIGHPSYLEKFSKYTDPKNHLLQFVKKDDLYYSGITMPLFYPNPGLWILINRENTLLDFFTLNHECAHAIMSSEETAGYDQTEHFFLKELEGYYFEFLTSQYLKEKLDKKTVIQLETQNFFNFYLNFNRFYITQLALYMYQKKRAVSSFSIQKFIMMKGLPFEINETELYNALLKNPNEDVRYIVSYFVNLELENIYKEDPEKSFWQFENIRKSKLNSIDEILKANGITNLEQTSQLSLQKKIEWLNENNE